MYTRDTFIQKIAPLAQTDMRKTGILASLTIAQACLESANGNSGLTQHANNLFGIKGQYNGQSVIMPTTEYYSGKKTRVNAAFRKYPSWQESISDHSSLFLRLDRYSNLRGCKDYKQACRNIQADGYATDPNYANLLISIIEQYHLEQYDGLINDDPQLAAAVSKLINHGINLNYNSWKRLDLINLNNVPALINKLGGIEFLVANGIITNHYLWNNGKPTADNVRSLIIKYAATLK